MVADSLYTTKFGGGALVGEGNISRDLNGGYYLYGSKDSVLSVSSQFTNHPNYLAHLNGNFEITWIKYYENSPVKQLLGGIKQLKDGSYFDGYQWRSK